MTTKPLRHEKGRDLMAKTVTRTVTRTTGGAEQAGRGAADRAASGAARKVLSKAGNAVLGAVVDTAISRVDRVADRLDRVTESGGTGLKAALKGRPATSRSDRKDAKATGTVVRARMGAAFSLVVARAIQLLQFLQRLAIQVLQALRRLARRSRTAPPEGEVADVDENGPEHDDARGAGEPSERRQRRTERRRPLAARIGARGSRPRRPVPPSAREGC